MEDWQYKLLIEAMAVQAIIDGMKAQNQYQVSLGDPLKYNEDDFNREAQDLQRMAHEMTMR